VVAIDWRHLDTVSRRSSVWGLGAWRPVRAAESQWESLRARHYGRL